jgi:hypothetical protein
MGTYQRCLVGAANGRLLVHHPAPWQQEMPADKNVIEQMLHHGTFQLNVRAVKLFIHFISMSSITRVFLVTRPKTMYNLSLPGSEHDGTTTAVALERLATSPERLDK